MPPSSLIRKNLDVIALKGNLLFVNKITNSLLPITFNVCKQTKKYPAQDLIK